MNTTISTLWASGRLILCGAAFVSGLISDGGEAIETQLSLQIAVDTVLVVLSPLLAYLGLWFVIDVQSRTSYSAQYWTIPTWKSNWLNVRDPAHFFHAGAFGVLALGAGLLAGFLVGNHGKLMDAVACIGGGLGLLVGVKRCPKLFPHKYGDVEKA